MGSAGEDPEVIAGLLALYHACGGSVHGHVPAEAFRRSLRKEYRQYAASMLKRLRRRGFIDVHKGRQESDSVNMRGVELLSSLGLLR
jgi:hypothetical protein